MTPIAAPDRMVDLAVDAPVWGRVFTVAPLALVGTREGGGGHNLAPKHMAMPLGWDNFWAFACTPRHATYANVLEHGEFTASFPLPGTVVRAGQAAAPRNHEGRKPGLAALRTFPARRVDGVLAEGCYLWLECTLERVVDGFGQNSLVVGRIAAAAADERALRHADGDDADALRECPLLGYLSPGRFAAIGDSVSFPFPAGFST